MSHIKTKRRQANIRLTFQQMYPNEDPSVAIDAKLLSIEIKDDTLYVLGKL